LHERHLYLSDTSDDFVSRIMPFCVRNEMRKNVTLPPHKMTRNDLKCHISLTDVRATGTEIFVLFCSICVNWWQGSCKHIELCLEGSLITVFQILL